MSWVIVLASSRTGDWTRDSVSGSSGSFRQARTAMVYRSPGHHPDMPRSDGCPANGSPGKAGVLVVSACPDGLSHVASGTVRNPR